MDDEFFGLDIGIVLTFFAAMIYLIISNVYLYMRVDFLKEQAIEAQCAQYSPTTSNFEWIHKNDTE